MRLAAKSPNRSRRGQVRRGSHQAPSSGGRSWRPVNEDEHGGAESGGDRRPEEAVAATGVEPIEGGKLGGREVEPGGGGEQGTALAAVGPRARIDTLPSISLRFRKKRRFFY